MGALPPDCQIVYKEIQKYFFKVGPIELSDGTLLSGIVDFFEESVAAGKGVLELIGTDVAAFAEDLVEDSPSYADRYQESISGKPGTSWPSGRTGSADGKGRARCRPYGETRGGDTGLRGTEGPRHQ